MGQKVNYLRGITLESLRNGIWDLTKVTDNFKPNPQSSMLDEKRESPGFEIACIRQA